MKKQIVFDAPFKQYIGIDYLGEGGAGQVYRTTDDNNNSYAVKRLNPNKINRKDLKRFKNEVDFCSRKPHPNINIIEILDSGNVVDGKPGIPFYVMPLYTTSFRKLLDEGIPAEKVLYYFNQLLNGMEAAHLLRVFHRDLKPENVLYDQTQDRLLIADFGIAHFEVEDLYTAAETSPLERLANFQYAAPEQRARGIKVDHRADIYALGLMLNEMFTRLIPYGTGYKTIGEVTPNYAYLDELVAEMLNQSVERRTNSIEAVKRQLIGRGDKFARLQRLNALKQTVVLVTDVDDPLINDPPTIIDANYIRGVLHIDLSQPVNDKWIWAFRNMGMYTSRVKFPENFDIFGDRAATRAEEDNAQQIVDDFQEWLPLANQKYAQMIRNEKQEEEERQRRELRLEIEELERQKRVKASLRI